MGLTRRVSWFCQEEEEEEEEEEGSYSMIHGFNSQGQLVLPGILKTRVSIKRDLASVKRDMVPTVFFFFLLYYILTIYYNYIELGASLVFSFLFGTIYGLFTQLYRTGCQPCFFFWYYILFTQLYRIGCQPCS